MECIEERSYVVSGVFELDPRHSVFISNFHKIQLNILLYFSANIEIHCGTLIITLVRMNITCCIRFMFVRKEIKSLLENIKF
jgi:hypothetical protein